MSRPSTAYAQLHRRGWGSCSCSSQARYRCLGEGERGRLDVIDEDLTREFCGTPRRNAVLQVPQAAPLLSKAEAHGMMVLGHLQGQRPTLVYSTSGSVRGSHVVLEVPRDSERNSIRKNTHLAPICNQLRKVLLFYAQTDGALQRCTACIVFAAVTGTSIAFKPSKPSRQSLQSKHSKRSCFPSTTGPDHRSQPQVPTADSSLKSKPQSPATGPRRKCWPPNPATNPR